MLTEIYHINCNILNKILNCAIYLFIYFIFCVTMPKLGFEYNLLNVSHRVRARLTRKSPNGFQKTLFSTFILLMRKLICRVFFQKWIKWRKKTKIRFFSQNFSIVHQNKLFASSRFSSSCREISICGPLSSSFTYLYVNSPKKFIFWWYYMIDSLLQLEM